MFLSFFWRTVKDTLSLFIPVLDRRIFVLCLCSVRHVPWILKRGRLESSGLQDQSSDNLFLNIKRENIYIYIYCKIIYKEEKSYFLKILVSFWTKFLFKMLDYFNFLYLFVFFSRIIFPKILMLLLKLTKDTIHQQKWP